MTADELIAEIEAAGFTVKLVDWCEDAETPGFLGSIAGKTSHSKRLVVIATRAVTNRTPEGLVATLEHELRHVREPEWDCGNRYVW